MRTALSATASDGGANALSPALKQKATRGQTGSTLTWRSIGEVHESDAMVAARISIAAPLLQTRGPLECHLHSRLPLRTARQERRAPFCASRDPLSASATKSSTTTNALAVTRALTPAVPLRTMRPAARRRPDVRAGAHHQRLFHALCTRRPLHLRS